MHQTTLAVDTAGAGMLAAYALDAGRRLVALRSQLPLINAEAPTAWVHVAYEGQWEGHESGPFEFTRAVFEQVIGNFEKQRNSVKLDFDHETVFSDGPTPARGWVHELELRNRESGDVSLWALVEFGREAVTINRDGGYRFCSGVFEFDATDRVSGDECGCEMTSLALTDSPFIDGQKPIQLSRRATARPEDSMKKDRILALMAISKESLAAALDQIEGDEITPEQLEAAAQFAAAKDGIEPDEPEAEEPALAADEADEEEDEAKAASLAEDDEDEEKKPLADDVPLQDPDADAAMAALAPLMEATGLDLVGVAAALSENLDAVAAALSGALQEPAADAPLGAQPPGMPGGGGTPNDNMSLSLRTTQTALGAVTKERDKLLHRIEDIEAKEAGDAVDAYVEAGVILDDARADMLTLYRQDRGTFGRIVASMKPRVPVGEHAGGDPEQTDHPAISAADEDTDEIKQLRRMLSATKRLTPAQMDKAVRERIASRRGTAI